MGGLLGISRASQGTRGQGGNGGELERVAQRQLSRAAGTLVALHGNGSWGQPGSDSKVLEGWSQGGDDLPRRPSWQITLRPGAPGVLDAPASVTSRPVTSSPPPPGQDRIPGALTWVLGSSLRKTSRSLSTSLATGPLRASSGALTEWFGSPHSPPWHGPSLLSLTFCHHHLPAS